MQQTLDPMHKHTWAWIVMFGLIAVMLMRLPPMAAEQDSVFGAFRALVEVDAIARQQFVEPIKDDRFVEGALRGMMFRLDPYSSFLNRDELAQMRHHNEGAYMGIGVELGFVHDKPTVIAAAPNGPAARAGILAGDSILSINGTRVHNQSMLDLQSLLRGEDGQPLTIVFRQRDGGEKRTTLVARESINIETIRGSHRNRDGQWVFLLETQTPIGYIRISNFVQTTGPDFVAALQSVVSAGARGLILDLRFNPGGLFTQAIYIADLFISEGVIVSTVTRRLATRDYRATKKTLAGKLPLVILINEASASAAEVLAGALQDHDRATIVGTRSFGKGSVQHLIHLQSMDAAIKLTTAYYRLPKGRIVHRYRGKKNNSNWGVLPDLIIELSDEQSRAIQQSWIEVEKKSKLSSHDDHVPAVIRDIQFTRAIQVLTQP